MGRIEDLSDRYLQHISTPWQRTVSGAQRVLMIVYDKELERTLRARKMAFENATRQALHDWVEVDLTDAFPRWMAADDYRDAYFESPADLSLKLDSEFSDYVAEPHPECPHAPRGDPEHRRRRVWRRNAVWLHPHVSCPEARRTGHPWTPRRVLPW